MSVELKNLYLQNISYYIDELVPYEPQTEKEIYDLAGAETNLQLADEELEYAEKCHKLQEQLGCPLDMILNLMKNSNTLDEHCHTQDIYFDYKGKLISGSFIKLEYDNEFIINVETSEMFDSYYDIDDYDLKVKDYKKTWWLKEDKSE